VPVSGAAGAAPMTLPGIADEEGEGVPRGRRARRFLSGGLDDGRDPGGLVNLAEAAVPPAPVPGAAAVFGHQRYIRGIED